MDFSDLVKLAWPTLPGIISAAFVWYQFERTRKSDRAKAEPTLIEVIDGAASRTIARLERNVADLVAENAKLHGLVDQLRGEVAQLKQTMVSRDRVERTGP